MGWRGGETPLAILFFFLREKRDVSGSDFFGAYYGVKKSSLTPLTILKFVASWVNCGCTNSLI